MIVNDFKGMKPVSLTISIISVLINTFWFAENSQASPISITQINNVTGQEQYHHISKRELTAPTINSKDNELINNDLGLQLNPVKIKNSSYKSKIIQSTSKTSNTKFTNSEFKDTFKDSSSTFTSNYGPVSRAPDESLKHCTTKACFE